MCGIVKSMMIFTDPNDIEKREDLRNLYDAWKKVIAPKASILSPVDNKRKKPLTFFNEDGFYPGYFSTKTKPRILFIGRESRLQSNKNGIPIDTIERDAPESWLDYVFYKRILYLVHGIKEKGKYKFENIRLEQVLKKMKTNNKYGFAFMNISKYSNDDSNYPANYKLINRFLEDSELDKRNFIREEIELLDPSIIITANLWNGKIKKKYLNMIFPPENFRETDNKDEAACMWEFNLNNHKVKLVETYHFSAINKKNEKTGKRECIDNQNDFYDPVMKLLFK